MIVFDAGSLIAHTNPDDAFHGAAREFMEEHEELEFAANALTMAECLVHPAAVGKGNLALGVYERLKLLSFEITLGDALGIADLRGATRLRMPDAVVLYTAERHGAELVTTDRSVARAAESRGVTAYLLEA
jgi:predicted nucleic acid-binding protein